MLYLNTCPNSDIIAIEYKNNQMIVRYKHKSDEVFQGASIASCLNLITGKKQKIDASLVDKHTEVCLYRDMLEIIWLINGAYVYTSPDDNCMQTLKRQNQIKSKLLSNYKLAPQKIELISDHQARDECGKLWDFGYAKMMIKLSAQLINKSNDQMRLEKELCKSAKMVNLSESFKYPRKDDGVDAITGRLGKDFIRTDRFDFSLRPDVLPSRAIRDLFILQEKPFIIECTMAIHIMEYKAILEFLGDEAFDRLFSEIGIKIARTSEGNPLLRFRSQISNQWQELVDDQKEFAAQIVPGDILYIRNIEPYLLRHAFGECNGHNVVYLGVNENGEKEFAGLFTIKKIRTYKEITDILIEDYNEQPHYIRHGTNGLECDRPGFGGVF